MYEVLTTKEGIPNRVQDFKLFFLIDIGNYNNGNVERSTTEVIYGNFSVALVRLIEAKGQGSCCRLVNYPPDFKPGNATGIFRGLTLAIVKIRRYGNNGFGDFFS